MERHSLMHTKVCTKCKRELLFEEFHKNTKTRDGLRSDCKRCKAVSDRKAKYGIHNNKYKDLYAEQKCLCAICLIPLAKVRVCVDHDHSTGKIRGLLCEKCNTGLGLFRDHPVIVSRAVQYLEKNK